MPARTIVGKAHCEYFCFSGGSHTCAAGPVHNPHKMGYSAGGSSSGSAVVVVTGEADMAIGGDQGGSIRMPSAFCGIYGMKATYGVVPYTGVMPIELTIDHTGPMTRDGRRQRADARSARRPRRARSAPERAETSTPTPRRWTAARRACKIGVVKEGFGHPQSEAEVDAKVEGRRRALQEAGRHRRRDLGADASGRPGDLAADRRRRRHRSMMKGNGYGFNWKGLYDTSAGRCAFRLGERADELSDTLKITMLLGQYFNKHYRGHYYAKAQNLTRKLTAAYDAALGQVRPAVDADPAAEGDTAAAAGRAARGHHPARLRDAAEHRAVRRHRAIRR